MTLPNHYEFLQISPNAEAETIHRVYRFLAVRFHPDNPDTGNADQFYELKQAYEVLSNPVRRAEYDRACNADGAEPDPLSTSIDFMDDIEGELNRRLGLLAVLYLRRRMHPEAPAVSLQEVESRMGFPRDYLEFTVWYLHKKGFISKADNSEFTLTADGVDFVEGQRVSMPVLQKLLTSGAGTHARNERALCLASNQNPYPLTSPWSGARAQTGVNGNGPTEQPSQGKTGSAAVLFGNREVERCAAPARAMARCADPRRLPASNE